jgi:hypothetical protein
LPAWRRFLRSSAAHNGLTLDDTDPVEYGGPFLWGGEATATVERAGLERDGDDLVAVTAGHDGYRHHAAPITVTRTVRLEPRALVVTDRLVASTPAPAASVSAASVSAAWTFGPAVLEPSLDGRVLTARLRDRTVTVELPDLHWDLVRGAPDGHGWWSPNFGVLQPTWALRGIGYVHAPVELAPLTVRW